MADNVPITAGSGTPIATDEVGGAHYQKVKLAFGPLDTATLVSAADPLPVSVGTVTITGGLTDAQIRATPLPVSGTVNVGTVPVTGTFWQTTQPVSGTVTANAGSGTFAISAASLPLPSGAATETTLGSINTKTLAAGQATMVNSSPVVIASNQSAVPVSGTFWQATQPVSGTVTANAGTGTMAVSIASLPALAAGTANIGDVDVLTLPALPAGTNNIGDVDVLTVNGVAPAFGSGARGVTVQRVTIATDDVVPCSQSGTWNIGSITTLPALAAGTAAIGKLAANTGVTIGAVEIAASQTLATVTNLSQLGGQAVAMGTGARSAGTLRVTVATDDLVAVSPPTLTKATQGSTGLSTQDLKDAGRVIVNAATAIAGVAAVATEALLALNVSRDGAATASVTTITVTSGKRFRVQAIVAGVRSSAATVLSGRVSLRMNPSGAVTASSPIIAILSMTQQAAALAEAGDTCVVAVPDGIEFSGTMQFGLSQVCSGTGGVVYASIIGYEY